MKQRWTAITSCLISCILLFSSGSSEAATANEFVANGRLQLVLGNLASAHTDFGNAVAADPSHESAHLLRAATTILSIPADPSVSNALDRLGIVRTNQNIYEWDFALPSERYALTNVESAQLVVDTVNMHVFPALLAAAEHLAKITSTFQITLTAQETKLDAVTIDYADTQIIRAALTCAASVGTLLTASDLDVQIAELTAVVTNETSSIQAFLDSNPALLAEASPARLATAKSLFLSAIAQYEIASDALRLRPAILERLFMLEAGEAPTEAKFRESLQDIEASLQRPVVLRHNTNVIVHAALAFEGAVTVRQLLPSFSSNHIVAASSSLHGLIDGDIPPVEDFWAEALGLDIAPRVWLEPDPAGLRFVLAGHSGEPHLIQASDNLTSWETVQAGEFTLHVRPSRGRAHLLVPNSSLERSRFYRAQAYKTAFNVPPAQNAPGSVQNQTYIFTPSGGQTRSIVFSPSGSNYTVQNQAGTQTEQGTYTYNTNGNNNATLTLTAANGDVSVVNFTFSANNAGSYQSTTTPAGGGTPTTESGTFGITNPVNPNPNPTNNTSIGGRRVKVQYPAWLGGQETLTFQGTDASGRFVSDFQPGAGGTYTAEIVANRVTLKLLYTSPAGDVSELILSRITATGGTFTGFVISGGTRTDVSGGNWSFTDGGPIPPAPNAPGNVQNQTYFFTSSGGQTRSIVFSPSGANYTAQDQAGTQTEQGAYTYNTNGNNNATLTLTAANGDVSVVNLTFSASNAGSYQSTTTPAGGGTPATESGTFGATNPVNPNPNPTNNTSIAGRRIQLQYPPTLGGQELLTFTGDNSSGTFVSDFQLGAGGTYTSSIAGNQITLNLTYTTPAGDTSTLVLSRSAGTVGTFTGFVISGGTSTDVSGGNWSFTDGGPIPVVYVPLIAGRRLELQYPSTVRGTETLTIEGNNSSGTFVSDTASGARGTYSASVAGSHMTLSLRYSNPPGHTATFILTQNSADGGTFGGTLINERGASTQFSGGSWIVRPIVSNPTGPATIAGRRIQLQYPPSIGGQELLTFQGDNLSGRFVSDFQPDAGGTYTASIVSSRIELSLTYSTPAGDTTILILTHSASNGGTFGGTLTAGGTATEVAGGAWSYAP